MINRELVFQHGDNVHVTYKDIAKSEEITGFEDAVQSFEQKGLFYPVTTVDGNVVSDGALSYADIRSAVDSRIERLSQLEV